MPRLGRRELVGLLVVLLVATAVRVVQPGADTPFDAEGTYAPLQDAYWYMEAASGPLEGSRPEPMPVYDPPLWGPLARTWFRVWGVSLASAQGLGALVSLACLLLTWRLVRSGLGPTAALVAAAVLAVLYPHVALSRTTLIYGPVTLVLLVAVGAWRLGSRGPLGRRVALEGAAWLLMIAAALTVRPPAITLVGGLVLATAYRHRRLRVPLLGLSAGVGLLVLCLWTVPEWRQALLSGMEDMGGVWRENSWRLQRKLDTGLDASELLRRLMAWGAIPSAGRAPGYAALAPGALFVAGLGGLFAWVDRKRLGPAAAETLLLLGGWLLTFVLSSLLVSLNERPLRYFMLLAPCVAGLAGFAAQRAGRTGPQVPLEGLRPLERLRVLDPLGWGLGLAVFGALVLPHLAWIFGRLPYHRVIPTGLEGAGLGLLAWLFLAGWPGHRRLAGRKACLLLACLAVAPGLMRTGAWLAHPTWHARAANAAAGRALPPETLLAGPYSSFLAFGNGLRRLRTPWVTTHPHTIDATIDRLRRLGTTHIALDSQQEATSDLIPRFAAKGIELELVLEVWPRGPAEGHDPQGPPPLPLRVHRFPWGNGVTPYKK